MDEDIYLRSVVEMSIFITLGKILIPLVDKGTN